MGPLAGWGHVGGGRGGPLTKKQVRFRNDVHTCLCLNFQRRNDSVVPRRLNNSVTVRATVSCCSSLDSLRSKLRRHLKSREGGSSDGSHGAHECRQSFAVGLQGQVAASNTAHLLPLTSFSATPTSSAQRPTFGNCWPKEGTLVGWLNLGRSKSTCLEAVSETVSETPPRASGPADVGMEQVSLTLGVRL